MARLEFSLQFQRTIPFLLQSTRSQMQSLIIALITYVLSRNITVDNTNLYHTVLRFNDNFGQILVIANFTRVCNNTTLQISKLPRDN